MRGRSTIFTQGGASIARIEGKTTGLKSDQLHRIERLARGKPRAQEIVSPETARRLAALSRETGRQLGLLIDRRGQVTHVLVGDRRGVLIPDLRLFRFSPGHLRGLRMVHTHLEPGGLDREDLTDLLLVRLDLMVAVEVDAAGLPGRTHLAYLVAEGEDRWTVHSYANPHEMRASPLDLIEQAEAQMRRHIRGITTEGVPRALLVGITGSSAERAEEAMAELAELARTAGMEVVSTYLQTRAKPDPRTIIGPGKLREITIDALDEAADILVFATELSPSQLRAVTDETELKVIDRTMLILDIFAQHAHSRGGKIQVELAQLRYLLPRLVGKGTALSRLAGGIGTRGPGETKLEVDRRRIRQRIGKLEKDLAHLTRERKTRRKRRGADTTPIVSIVGYTNVGKSTLLNTLTRSDEVAENKLFATLDPVSRRLTTAEGTLCILTDTVGLIRDLPPELERAFAATFEEIGDADLILHLADASAPNTGEQIVTVEETLESLGLEGIPVMLVLNKSDLVERSVLPNLRRRFGALTVSALDRDTLGEMVGEVRARLNEMATRRRREAEGLST
ncbi:MAG: GTPase HflX [bacterium]|nr:MAG: GTPase HflX [bacterium]